ncbi:hypothetical protein KKC17_01880 [Patescibacteria group bacterium]|nr:hypothetical protein [Patescibacteria group bacterium]
MEVAAYDPTKCQILNPENFTVEGASWQGIIEKIIYSSKANRLTTSRTNGTILLVDITKGTVNLTSKEIEIFANGKKIFDSMVRLEKNKNEIYAGKPGDKVGICLKKTLVKEFAKLLN